MSSAYSKTFTLLDLRPLRPIVASGAERYGEPLLRVVRGFDMLLVMSGSTSASNLTWSSLNSE